MNTQNKNTIVPFRPDEIHCFENTGSFNKNIYTKTFYINEETEGDEYITYHNINTGQNILFNPDGSYGGGSTDDDCSNESLSINTLYERGQAFNYTTDAEDTAMIVGQYNVLFGGFIIFFICFFGMIWLFKNKKN